MNSRWPDTAQRKGCGTELSSSGTLCSRYTLYTQEGQETVKSNITIALVKLEYYSALFRFYLSSLFETLTCLLVARSGKEFLIFDLDTLFDVNSIVSEVLL